MGKIKVTDISELTRRNLLRGLGGCAALTQTSMLSTLLQLSMTRSAVAAIDTSGYKALVGVFLHGGIDSYNVLVPISIGQNEDYSIVPYEDYFEARSTLALPMGSLNIISDSADLDYRTYGLHQNLPDLKSLYDAGNLAFVANIGSLIEPVDQGTYGNGARLPLGLFSHSDQQRHWQTSTPQSRTQITGWLGRMADVLNDTVNNNEAISMNIAIDNLNILQTGDTVVPYVVDDQNGAEVLAGYELNNPMDIILTESTNSFLEQSYSDLLKQTHANVNRQAIDAAVAYNEATQSVPIDPALSIILQGSSLGRKLLQVARAIGAHQLLGQDRQAFFVERGGFDNHANLLPTQGNLLTEVNDALSAFYQVTVDLGVANDVLTFTASDFARTLNANSNVGSDHAWGGNHFVMGGDVIGQRLYGTYPESLAPGNNLDLGRGRLIPTLSVDEYAAELAMWFGIENDSILESIVPNIRNFYSASETLRPLGFTA